MGVTRYLMAGAATAALLGGLWGCWWQGRAADLSDDLAAAEARTAATEAALVAARATIAAQSAHVARVEAEAARADQIRRDIMEATDADCNLPDWLRTLPDRLRATGASGAADPR